MALSLYLSASLLVFVLSSGPFFRDPSNPKAHLSGWAFLALAMVLSPITLPNILRKRLGSQGSPVISDLVASESQSIPG